MKEDDQNGGGGKSADRYKWSVHWKIRKEWGRLCHDT